MGLVLRVRIAGLNKGKFGQREHKGLPNPKSHWMSTMCLIHKAILLVYAGRITHPQSVSLLHQQISSTLSTITIERIRLYNSAASSDVLDIH